MTVVELIQKRDGTTTSLGLWTDLAAVVKHLDDEEPGHTYLALWDPVQGVHRITEKHGRHVAILEARHREVKS